MPQINMQIALTNPYTLDKFDVIRRKQDISDQGEVSVVLQPFPGVYGTVSPSVSQKDLMRLTDEQLQSKGITITTRFALRGESEDAGQQDFQPDIIVWNGDNFLVVLVDDYSNFAAGFIRAVCIMMDINAVPAVTKNVSMIPPSPPPPQLPASTLEINHYPVETPDGMIATFTFLGLPSDSSKYALYWNGLRQQFFTQSGQTVTLDAPPEVGAEIYAVW